MPLDDKRRVGWRLVHEILFSLNVSFLALTVWFAVDERVSSVFSRMESSINLVLGIRQTDFVRGYFAILVPSISVALLLWMVLRMSARTSVVNQVLRVCAGIVALFGLPAFWSVAIKDRGFPYQGVPAELTVVLVCAIAFLRGRLHMQVWIVSVLLAAHYAFYWFGVGGQSYSPNYAGPIAPVLSFCSALTWAMYVRPQSSQVSASPSQAPSRV